MMRRDKKLFLLPVFVLIVLASVSVVSAIVVDDVSVGGAHSLFIDTSGNVFATGLNFGQLGDGTVISRNITAQVVGVGGVGNLIDVIATAGGGFHSLFLKSDGTVFATGLNSNGQLGDGTTTNTLTPVQVLGVGGAGNLTGVIVIAAGFTHSFALKSDGTVFAWGNNVFGQIGDGTTTPSSTPVQVLGVGGAGNLTGITAISGGAQHSLALKSDGTVFAWGANSQEQLGNSTVITSSTPVRVNANFGGTVLLTGITAISGGAQHSLALKSDGTVFAWGRNANGQLGDGTTTSSVVPAPVVGVGGAGNLTGITAISGGTSHSLFLKSDGTVFATGLNSNGQLGDGTTTQRTTPVQVEGVGGAGNLTGIIDIAGAGPAGFSYSLAVDSSGTAFAWGNNFFGQLGDGTISFLQTTPVTVNGTEAPAQVCGNGIVESPEVCDDGDATDAGICNAACTGLTFCGDGTVQTPNGNPGSNEQCDDGNAVNGDGCSNTCTIEVCDTAITTKGHFVGKNKLSRLKEPEAGVTAVMLSVAAVKSACGSISDTACVFNNLATINTNGDPVESTNSNGQAVISSSINDPDGYVIYLDKDGATVLGGSITITSGATQRFKRLDVACNPTIDFLNILSSTDGVTATTFGPKHKQLSGSVLDIMYPEEAVWGGASELLYPFFFTSDSEWTVDVCAKVPSGYEIVGTYDESGNLVTSSDCLQAFVAGETKVIAFDIVQTGSPPVWALKAKLKAKGPNGVVQNLNLDVPSVVLEKAKGRPFAGLVTAIGSSGGLIIGLIVIIALIALLVVRSRKR